MFDGIFGYCDVNPEQEKDLGQQNRSIEQFLLTFLGIRADSKSITFHGARRHLNFKLLSVASNIADRLVRLNNPAAQKIRVIRAF